MKIEIKPSPRALPDAERQAKVDEGGFGKYFTDHMVVADWNAESGWSDATLKGYEPLTLDPASMVFHYGQEIFEGLKAYWQPDGSISLFRPEMNGKRFANSAKRLALPELPVEYFVATIETLVKHDRGWVPPKVGSSPVPPIDARTYSVEIQTVTADVIEK